MACFIVPATEAIVVTAATLIVKAKEKKSEPQTFTYEAKDGSIATGEKVSLFALDGAAHGITLEGFYYSLQNGTLYPFDPMGTSNYITAPQGKVTVKKGTLLIVISKENQ